MKRTLAIAVAATIFGGPAWADTSVSLKGADAPDDTPWDKGATLARSGGKTILDGVLKLEYSRDDARSKRGKPEDGSIHRDFNVGIYGHRNPDDTKPQNDRGLSFGYEGFVVPKGESDGPVQSWGWSLKNEFGKTLKQDDSGQNINTDTDRQVIRGSYYRQPAIGGIPGSGGLARIFYFKFEAGLYSDHSRGGAASTDGRVSGPMASISAGWAPFGLDARDAAGKYAIGFIPMLSASTQIEHDLSASEGRAKENRKLHTITLDLKFGKADKDKTTAVPSLLISRSVGADVLTGREKKGETKVAFAILF